MTNFTRVTFSMCLSPTRYGCAEKYPQLDANNHTLQGYWQTRFNAIYLHGRKFGGNRDAIIHTGSSLVLGDSKTVQALYKQIRGSTDLGGGIYSGTCMRLHS